jgi:hypothetical protein
LGELARGTTARRHQENFAGLPGSSLWQWKTLTIGTERIPVKGIPPKALLVAPLEIA